jgi:hypothetical protein
MMFPDTSNEQQYAALRQAAERARRLANPQHEYEQAACRPVPSMWEGFRSAGMLALSRFESTPEEHSIVSH